MPRTTLEALADATRTPLPWRPPQRPVTREPIPPPLTDALATFGSPEVIVDLGRIEELTGIREDSDALVIGAMTPHSVVQADPLIAEHARLISLATATIADPQVRHRGTFGGSLAHADPAGDLPAVAVALEERAVPYRLTGAAAFFQRAEVRDLLAWLRLLEDPGDAGAVVRALARPPIELRSIDLARVTQIARRRKLDMVGALGAALESPQIPPEARERIVTFLKLYRSASGALDSTRPDLFVHRMIERLGLRRQLLFAATAEVVDLDEMDNGWIQVITRFTLEVEGNEKPCCVADSVGRALPE